MQLIFFFCFVCNYLGIIYDAVDRIIDFMCYSSRQFTKGGLSAVVSAALVESQVAPGLLDLELTESILMEDRDEPIRCLRDLKSLGLRLSIDDFGTGYSSMEQLQRIPFSEFKIDRAFVHGADRDSAALAILESSVLLAQKLEMKVVAEGVEDQRDWDLVSRLGCDQVQGYFVSRPLSFSALLKWLQNPQNIEKFKSPS